LKRKRSILDGGDADSQHSHSNSDGNLDGHEARRVVLKVLSRKKRARNDGVPRCEKCDRMAWTESNQLMTCGNCDDSWHQRCHDPEIDTVAADGQNQFQCAECSKGFEEHTKLQEAQAERASWKRQQEIARMREKKLAALPGSAVIDKPELIGFPAGGAADWEVRKVILMLTS
jgi:PHD-finger